MPGSTCRLGRVCACVPILHRLLGTHALLYPICLSCTVCSNTCVYLLHCALQQKEFPSAHFIRFDLRVCVLHSMRGPLGLPPPHTHAHTHAHTHTHTHAKTHTLSLTRARGHTHTHAHTHTHTDADTDAYVVKETNAV